MLSRKPSTAIAALNTMKQRFHLITSKHMRLYLICFALIIPLISSCGGCKTYTEILDTRIENNLQVSIDVEYRFQNTVNNDGTVDYLYFTTSIPAGYSGMYEITRKEHTRSGKDAYICYGKDDVLTIDSQVQFSQNTLSQVTICDTTNISYGNGPVIIPPRYEIYPIGSSCGEYRQIDISEGYV